MNKLFWIPFVLASLLVFSILKFLKISEERPKVVEIKQVYCKVGEIKKPKLFTEKGKTYFGLTMNCCTNLTVEKIEDGVLYLKETGMICRCFCYREFEVKGIFNKVVIKLKGGKTVEIK